MCERRSSRHDPSHPLTGARYEQRDQICIEAGTGRATRRASLAAVVLAAGWLCLGAASAWADSVIDTTGCTIDGRAELSGTPSSPNQLGAEFVASDNPQAVTLSLYNANSTGPVGPPLWTAPATVDSTGSPTTFALQTFTIDGVLGAAVGYRRERGRLHRRRRPVLGPEVDDRAELHGGRSVRSQTAGGGPRTATLNIPYANGSTAPIGGNSPLGVLTASLSGTATSTPSPAGSAGTAGTSGSGSSGTTTKTELVTCKPTTKTVEVDGHNRRVSTEQCTTKLVTAPVVFPSGSDVTATLSRSSVVYAAGRGNNSRVELSARRTIKPGHLCTCATPRPEYHARAGDDRLTRV